MCAHTCGLGLLIICCAVLCCVVQSTAALPFGTIVIILIIWGLVTVPLTIFGGIAGKNNKTDFAAPCRHVFYAAVQASGANLCWMS